MLGKCFGGCSYFCITSLVAYMPILLHTTNILVGLISRYVSNEPARGSQTSGNFQILVADIPASGSEKVKREWSDLSDLAS